MTKILIIEDNDGVREEIVDILRYAGYDVRDAENGRLGLELVTQWAPDLVVCDLMMPELDGYATLAAIRADSASATTPFLCLTARGEQRDMQKAMDLGADDYLRKPFTTDELLAALESILAKRRQPVARAT
jgi:DNA-binding response OmpR family regulator